MKISIYTRLGDGGETALFTGEVVEKSHPRIVVLGGIDELSCHLGEVRAQFPGNPMGQQLAHIQNLLSKMMGLVAGSDDVFPGQEVKALESWIDGYQAKTKPLHSFTLPGKNPLSAKVHVARAVARRVEVSVFQATKLCHERTTTLKQLLVYLNRLSDYLFALALVLEEDASTTSDISGGTLCGSIPLQMAEEIIKKTKAYAEYKGCKLVICVVGNTGLPVSLQVMDDAYVISYELALKKAFSAVALKMPTHELAKLTKEGASLEGLEGMLEGKIITLGGGAPIICGNKIIGGIGVSGSSVEDDIEIAAYGAGGLSS